ncbi:MAG: hypothetical protein MPJ50_03850 [Pirellulales bacterium]|nr:hypothetical protein [Pirellulales bacterium]
MSGPIVRSGASPEFSQNWERIFAKPGKKSTKPNATSKSKAKQAASKPVKKSATKTTKKRTT